MEKNIYSDTGSLYKRGLKRIANRGFADLFRLVLNLRNYPAYYRWCIRTIATERASRFLQKEGVTEYYKVGSSLGRIPRYAQCYLVYKTIRETKPKIVLEFGSGWTTVTIAAALSKNFEEDSEYYQNIRPVSHVVEASEDWANNTKNNLSEHLRAFCQFYSPVPQVQVMNGDIWTMYDSLPNIGPDVILVDGPSASQITGDIRGLRVGRPVTSDLKFFENRFSPTVTILVEKRVATVEFLLRNLTGYYVCTYLPLSKHFVFQKQGSLNRIRGRSPVEGAPMGGRAFKRFMKKQLNNKKVIKVKNDYSLLP